MFGIDGKHDSSVRGMVVRTGGFLVEVGTGLDGFGDIEKIKERTRSQENSVRKARKQNKNHFGGDVSLGCVTCRENAWL